MTSKRQIRLTYVATGESVLAEMLDDEAPQVCELVWSILPVEKKVIHGMYSGAEVFAMIDNPQPARRKNMVQLPLPGELLYFYDASTGASREKAGWRNLRRLWPGCRPSCPRRRADALRLFARIPGDWKYDWNPFGRACRKARWEGPQLLRIERVE